MSVSLPTHFGVLDMLPVERFHQIVLGGRRSGKTQAMIAAVQHHEITLRERKLVIGEKLIDFVCHQYDVTRSALLGRRRFERLAWARHLAMYLVREITGLDTATVAELFWRENHSTVLSALAKMRSLDPRRSAEVRAMLVLARQSIFNPEPACADEAG